MGESKNAPLSPDQIKTLLSSTRSPKGPSTEPREIAIWYKQDHILREEGCTNPNCRDNRPRNDVGRQIVLSHKGEFMCRSCFLGGWLSVGTGS